MLIAETIGGALLGLIVYWTDHQSVWIALLFGYLLLAIAKKGLPTRFDDLVCGKWSPADWASRLRFGFFSCVGAGIAAKDPLLSAVVFLLVIVQGVVWHDPNADADSSSLSEHSQQL